MKKADLLVPAVSAASIIAKVARDNFMTKQDDVFPGYEFKKHVGYGTVVHTTAIDNLGITPLHRLSFAPLKKYAKLSNKFKKNNDSGNLVNETTKQIGDSAETVAANYLMKMGHKIIDRNWKTKYCEIDIVSQIKDVIYFTEVKYRKSQNQGGGLAAITPKKMNQMKFAAEFYALSNKIDDTNLRLSVVSLYGKPSVVDVFLEV